MTSHTPICIYDEDDYSNKQSSKASSESDLYNSSPDLDETSGDNQNYGSNDDDNSETDVELKKSLMKHLVQRNNARKQRRITRRAKMKAQREREMAKSEEKLAVRAKAREMTPMQEVWNVVTMLPCPLYFMLFVFAGHWLKDEDIHNIRDNMSASPDMSDLKDDSWGITAILNNIFADENRCIRSHYFPNLHALPPTRLIVATLGATLHAPCSMLYHTLCACYLPSGPKRMDHWSRRLDQAMIHFVSLCWSFGCSENKDFILASAVFNFDSMYRLFQSGYRPGRLIIRMAMAFVLPAFQFLVQGDFFIFGELIAIYAASYWLFAKYPFGGWSHGIFHCVLLFTNPIILKAALSSLLSQEQIQHAAKCAVLAEV